MDDQKRADLPIVSLEHWWSGADSDRAATAATLDDALQRWGFLLVTDHGIPDRLPNDIRAAMRRFFSLDDSVKAQYVTEHNRGWVASNTETVAATYGVETAPDMRESFVFGPEDRPDDEYHREGTPEWFGPTPYPDEIPGLRDSVVEWTSGSTRVARAVMEACAIALDIDPADVLNVCQRPASTSAVHWYPPLSKTGPPRPGAFRIGPHTDFNTVTVLDREPGVGALEIQDIDGAWLQAPHVPGALLINVGDLMTIWSSGRWRSTYHRVLPPQGSAPDEDLMSLVFFLAADYDAMIVPLVGDPAPPFEFGSWRRAKMALLAEGLPGNAD